MTSLAPVDTALLLPMATHVALAALLYVLLTIARAPAIWGIGRRADGSNPWATVEPRISANLSNQFEWPLFFHIACIMLMLLGTRPAPSHWPGSSSPAACCTARQVLTANVRLRGLVFTLNFLAVLGLWGLLLWMALERVSW